ncbi:hypothetical protein Bca4012_058813 [Brassica carinata]
MMENSLYSDANPKADVLVTPTLAGGVVADGEKSKAGKKRAKAQWAKLLSQYHQVSGKCYQKSACVHLCGGDEVIFSVSGRHAYIFQPLKDENLAALDRASSVNVCEARGAPLKGVHVETRAGILHHYGIPPEM